MIEVDPMVFAAAAVLVIGAIGTQWVQIINARATLVKINAQSLKIDEVVSETKVIGGHVNSAASELKAENKALTEKIEMMNKVAADIKEALLLSNVAVNKINGTVNKINGTTKDDSYLEKIESNTASIDENTKKTTADVENLKRDVKEKKGKKDGNSK